MFTVFFVDDEPLVIEGLHIMVDWKNLAIDIAGYAGDGKSAYEKIIELKPDIVISDIRMPEMDGNSLIKKCSETMEKPPKFIMLSGYNELDYLKNTMRYGSKHYLLKPLDPEEIQSTLAEVCDEIIADREQEEENERLVQYVIEDTFRKLFFCKNDSEIIEKTRFLLNVPSVDTRLSMVLFSLSTHLNNSDIYEFVEILKKSTVNKDALIMYAGMRVVAAVGEEKPEEQLRKFAAIGENNCYNICICSVQGVNSLQNMFRYVISNFKSNLGVTTVIPKRGRTDYDFKFDIDTDKIVTMLLKMDKGSVVKAIKSDFDDMRKKNIAREIARGYMSSLLLSMYRYSSEMEMNLEEIYNEAIKQLNYTRDYDSIEVLCIDLINNFKDSVTNITRSDDLAIEKEILEYIEKHYSERITLNDISNTVYLQPGSVSKIIKKRTKMKFSDYLAYVRIKHAQRLMTNTNRKISQIAADVGYNYYYYFANQFKSITGYSPSDYRKQMRK